MTRRWNLLHRPAIKKLSLQKKKLRKSQRKNFVYSEHGKVLRVDGKLSQAKVICKYCKLVIHYNSFKIHYYSLHFKTTVFECDQCNKPFTQKIRLNEHKILAHSVPDNSAFPCQLCEDSFPIKRALTVHVRKMHSKSQIVHKKSKHIVHKKYPCNIPGCLKKFSTNSFLKKHYNLEHLKMTKHPCLFCKKSQPIIFIFYKLF